jgi:GT2 family glycosyltransferase
MSTQPIVDETSVQIEKIAKAINKRCKQLDNQDNLKLEGQEQDFLNIVEKRTVESATKYDKPVVLVVVTNSSEAKYKETSEYKTIENQIYLNSVYTGGSVKTPLTLEIVADNTMGYSAAYNKFFTEKYEDHYVCFIKDDVRLTDINFFQKLQEAHRRSEVVGVAGATRVQIPFTVKSPTLWTALSEFPDPKTGKPSKHQSGSYTTFLGGKSIAVNYGASPAICRFIDGVLMSFDVSKSIGYGFSFDERFPLDHHDLAACLIAAKSGLNISTWPISIEKTTFPKDVDTTWKQSHTKFVQVYKDFKM